MSKTERIVWFIVILILALLIITSCASNHMRETLQRDNPDCTVSEDLELNCPNQPNDNAGFGIGVRVIKPLIIEQGEE